MKIKRKGLLKILSMVMVLVMIITAIPLGMMLTASAVSPYQKTADASTMDDWKQFFGKDTDNTQNAGGIWTDKTVLTDASQLPELKDAYGDNVNLAVADDSFLVALSAIASNKSIIGYSYIPTDTVLLLDISNSMNNSGSVDEMVLAANAAITRLLELNKNNRVGVVVYSATFGSSVVNDAHSYTFFPIDRYTASSTVTYDNGTSNKNDDIKVGKYLTSSGTTISIASGVKNSAKKTMSKSVRVSGVTFIQNGLDRLSDVFEAAAKNGGSVISGDGFQAGVQRMPVMVLMSDGAPTIGTTSYTSPSNYNVGNGSASSAQLAFLTQLTASYVRQRVKGFYNNTEPLFYTLGLAVGSDSNATSVLNPTKTTSTIKNWWTSYLKASNNASVSLKNGNSTFSVKRNSRVTGYDYVDMYFAANNSNALMKAFNSIVDQIIIQSLYRPTLVETDANNDGYIEFIDDIGDFMKVEDIKGIMIGDKLYTGEYLCEQFKNPTTSLGTVSKPTALGRAFVSAVQKRIGVASFNDAYQLISNAYNHGQLSYKSANDYSNYIGWYSDADGKYLGFWDESHTYAQKPDNAVYVNKSYGMLGEIADGYNESDLMYVAIQVHTKIADQATFNASDNDVLIPGHAQILFRIPSSLIPVVSYNVSLDGTSYATAKNITMEIDDAEPIRLLFEVGLRNDVDEYNIVEILQDNFRVENPNDPDYGKYRLYTNEWSIQQFDNSISNSDDAEYIAPTEAINTISFFEPSHENERYYYTENTTVYVKDGDTFKKYEGEKPVWADDTYYRQLNVFRYTDADDDNNAAELVQSYEEISKESFEKIVKDATNNTWDIPKNTIHRTMDIYYDRKDENATNTIAYSHYPVIENGENYYYASVIHGNNGLLTVTPATGIKITKEIDDTIAGVTDAFEFTVTVEGASGSYKALYQNADGERTEKTVKFDLDSATVELKAGETVYIVGLPVGAEYTVTETQTELYDVAEKKNDKGVIKDKLLAEVEFVNTMKRSGYLVVSKQVEHPFATDPQLMKDIEFDFTVTLSNGDFDYTEDKVEAHYTDAPDKVITLDVVNNKIEFTLKDNRAIHIELLQGWTADVKEEAKLPDGFTLDENKTVIPDNKVISTSENVVYGFVNNYEPAEVELDDVTLELSKTLLGRNWLDRDEFRFVLSRYNTANGHYEAIGKVESVKKPASGKKIEFGEVLTEALNNEKYSAVGTYHYQITELVPLDTLGISYDRASRNFDVVVTDNDIDGKYEYTVVAKTETTVTNDNGDYTVKADFENVYSASGIAEIELEILKEVQSSTGEAFPLENFEFTVYDKATNEVVGVPNTTDAEGRAEFVFAYTADLVTADTPKVFNYVIKETNSGIPAMTYAKDIEFSVTVRDTLDGKITAEADIAKKDADGKYLVDVTNIYSPDPAEAIIDGTKIYLDFAGNNKALVGGEFTFALTQTDADFNKLADGDEFTTVNNAEGKFEFDLSFDKVGTYYYTLTEVTGSDELVEYDTGIYEVKIVVTDDVSGKLKADVEIFKKDDGSTDVVFTNIYTPVPTDLYIHMYALKKVNNVGFDKIGLKGFEFELRQHDSENVWNKLSVPDGKAEFRLRYTKDDIGKTYTYTLKEIAGDNPYIVYDTTEYTITVSISLDKETNTLVAEITKNDVKVDKVNAVFTNIYDYTPTPDNIRVYFTANKIVKNKGTDKIGPNGFEFILENVESGEKVKKTTGITGTVIFSEEYTADDIGKIFKYKLYEKEGSKPYVTYDDTVYEISVKVLLDEKTNEIYTEIIKDGREVSLVLVQFVNIYDFTPDVPTTEPDEPTTEPDEPTTEPDEPTTEPDEPTTEPDEPTTEPDEPTTEPDEPTTEEPTTEKPTEENVDVPKTGIEHGIVLWVMMFLLGGAALVLLRKKKVK